MCRGDAELWSGLPSGCTPRPELVEAAAKLISGCRTTFSPRFAGPVPIWEAELVERFQEADAKGDWAEIESLWPRLEAALHSELLLDELVCFLRCYAFDKLVEALDALPQTPDVMRLVGMLSNSQRIRLALSARSARVRFCCVYMTLAQRPAFENFEQNDHEALCTLLAKVAADVDEWRIWMRAFNTYPSRYPALHAALGKALADASHEAAIAYVDSITLHTCPVGKPERGNSRSLIGTSLGIFARHASPEHRRAVWGHAFQRWQDWRFDQGSRESYLSEIQHSELDFAVVAYVVECMSVADRENAVEDVRRQLGRLETVWHEAVEDCVSEWNRLLSILQPYAHAAAIASSGGDPLIKVVTYWPFDASKSLYHRIMFHVHPESLGLR